MLGEGKTCKLLVVFTLFFMKFNFVVVDFSQLFSFSRKCYLRKFSKMSFSERGKMKTKLCIDIQRCSIHNKQIGWWLRL